jgi:hypothetical protein
MRYWRWGEGCHMRSNGSHLDQRDDADIGASPVTLNPALLVMLSKKEG